MTLEIGEASSSILIESNPCSIFIVAISSPVTKSKYLQRMGYFFDFIGIEKNKCVEERCNIFGERLKIMKILNGLLIV